MVTNFLEFEYSIVELENSNGKYVSNTCQKWILFQIILVNNYKSFILSSSFNQMSDMTYDDDGDEVKVHLSLDHLVTISTNKNE
ncbi:hypothetical protein DERF_014794 [Dermatophagoides farinae]|uniref:Uncharacterized protein n=1 Tax=Dermatophagoides farinae TaxID=6954 RepID=A0A922HNM0_DERFA|nr:hypothetical protein DERF_014794 [Dermatophagoides farinae]